MNRTEVREMDRGVLILLLVPFVTDLGIFVRLNVLDADRQVEDHACLQLLFYTRLDGKVGVPELVANDRAKALLGKKEGGRVVSAVLRRRVQMRQLYSTKHTARHAIRSRVVSPCRQPSYKQKAWENKKKEI